MKTCNLSTVKNTPSEARRNASTVEYYYIDFQDTSFELVPRWRSLRAVIECIWELLEDVDLYTLGSLYICAYMSDGSIRRVRYLEIDEENRHIRICRVR